MKSKYTKQLISILEYLLIIVGVLLFTKFVITPGLVSGNSMYPTYHNNDGILIKRIGNDYQKDDVISFRYDEEQNEFASQFFGPEIMQEYEKKVGEAHIKRIVGTPGQKIDIINENGVNYLMIDGVLYDEFSIPSPIPSQSYVLGEDEYFVLGDNREVSYDSLYHGPITKDQLLGEVIVHIPNIFEQNKE